MHINQEILKKMLQCAAELFQSESPYLGEIDAKFGDGDHGVTMHKIGDLIMQALADWSDASIGEFLEDLGNRIMGVNGGSAGPLYGTMIGGLAVPLNEETEIDAALLKKMIQSMQSEMEDITTAKVGDKTMMDALIPAVLAAVSATGDISHILDAAAKAAKTGAEDSRQYQSKFGRAKSYKEQTIGTPDAGAVSTSLLFQGLAAGVKS